MVSSVWKCSEIRGGEGGGMGFGRRDGEEDWGSEYFAVEIWEVLGGCCVFGAYLRVGEKEER